MGGTVKKYLKKEFQLKKFSLDFDDLSDFYLSCWQRGQSIWPLLVIRTLVFIGFAGSVVAAFVVLVQDDINPGYGFIFMTRWGLYVNTITSFLACCVSLTELFRGSNTTPAVLVKAYWLCYNISSTLAFFITIFYYSFLTEVAAEGGYEVNPVVDLLLHGINSVLMFCLLITSRHPHRLMHFYIPLLFAIIYVIFSVIYYFAGGMSPIGTHWIYPQLDWEKPGEAMILIVAVALVLSVLHMVVALMTLCRDAITRRCRDNTVLLISSR
uniref:Protein rolling stone-like n=1 Tax=Heliothis virescens TaxID=7102 RepID=A0A2A4JV90_HELVI